MNQSVIYLLPLVFMLHEFEEIIMMPDWLQQNQAQLTKRFPSIRLMFNSLGKLPAPAFTLAVAEEFILLSACTLITTAYGLITAWYCCLLAFGIHLVVHLVQFLIAPGDGGKVLSSVPYQDISPGSPSGNQTAGTKRIQLPNFSDSLRTDNLLLVRYGTGQN